MTHSSEDQFWPLIEGIKVCMMTTNEKGRLLARPMTPFVDRAESVIRFIAQLSDYDRTMRSGAAEVNLAFVDADQDVYVSVSGTALATQDQGLIDRLKKSEAGAYAGPDDEDMAVLTVTPNSAEAWSQKARAPTGAWEFQTARLQREAAHPRTAKA